MYPRKILNKTTKAIIFDIAKSLRYYFDKFSTEQIFSLILQVDSIDLAIDALFLVKDEPKRLNEVIYDILLYRDNKKD